MASMEGLPLPQGHWLPVDRTGFHPKRWLLLEGNRLGVIVGLLLLIFTANLVIGTIWTFKMQVLLTETSSVQTLLNTFLSGIILLVSIVVSISAIVLSYDITALDSQENRIDAAMEFRREVEELTEESETPTTPSGFLKAMNRIIQVRAERLSEAVNESDSESSETLSEYTSGVMETVDRLERSLNHVDRGDFSALWEGLEVEYGTHLNRSDRISRQHADRLPEEYSEQFDELVRAFELFATGKEYFKTLYYNREISQLSRVLLLISLPTIMIVASAVLAIDAGLLPQFRVLGLPPLLTFVSAVITVALAPFVVLTSYMLRIATVAKRTAFTGPFAMGP